MKNILCILFLFAGFSSANAQMLKVGIGPELALPTGNAANISGVGVGGYLKFEQAIAEKFALTETAEFTNFFGKKFLGNRSQSLTYLPVKLGLKYFPSENFYTEGQAGLAFPINNGGKSNFTWALGLGSFINTGNKNALFDFGLRYQVLTNTIQQSIIEQGRTNFGYFSLRVGYVLGI